jgi:hypothetical protein
MSGWGATPARYPGTPTDSGPLRECSRCDLDKPRAGGVELGPNRWTCSECWKSAQALRRAAERAMR